jgi:ribosome-binding ATPase YchF (GTP1/OBG family)
MNNMEIPIEKSAQAINNYFFNITDNLKIQTNFHSSPISLLKNVNQNDISQMNVIPVTEREMQSIISSMKAKDSSGYDGMATKILKICNLLISKPLCYICNKSIQTGIFPDCLFVQL